MTEIRTLSLKDENRLEELVAFNVSVHKDVEAMFRRVVVSNPESNDPAFHRYLLEGDRIVAAASLIPHTMNWHGSRIRAGELGLVGTLAEFRDRGYSSALINGWLETMKQDGVPLSFLWGIPGFYEKFHYYHAFPHCRTSYVSLPRTCVSDWRATGTIREAGAADLWWIQKQYRLYNAELTGCVDRNEAVWEWIFDLTTAGGRGKWWVTEDPAGGYAVIDSRLKKVVEIAVPSESSLRNIVLGLFRAYPDFDSLDFWHHPDMPAGRWLYHAGAQIRSPEDIWTGTWAGMVRVVDLVALLTLMSAKLHRRLADSRFCGHSRALEISSEIGSVRIDLSPEKVEICPLDSPSNPIQIPASVLTPLLTGYRGFERYQRSFTHLDLETQQLLCVLFPRDKVFVYPLLYVDEQFSAY